MISTPSFDHWQWLLLVLGALSVGVSKTGVPGLSMLFVAVFADEDMLGARASTGVILPLLIIGDVFAVRSYRQHLVWSHVWRLFPWTIIGVLAGWLALGKLNDLWTSRLIGAILLTMLGFHFWRKRSAAASPEQPVAPSPQLAPVSGVLAGFCTMVANAAGPVMSTYLLAMRLPKLEFMGTSAVFFLLLNWAKVPFMVHLGIINPGSLKLNLWLAPAVIVGALAGRWLAGKISQRWFELLTLALSTIAAGKLILKN